MNQAPSVWLSGVVILKLKVLPATCVGSAYHPNTNEDRRTRQTMTLRCIEACVPWQFQCMHVYDTFERDVSYLVVRGQTIDLAHWD
jgi:hypothetical protein